MGMQTTVLNCAIQRRVLCLCSSSFSRNQQGNGSPRVSPGLSTDVTLEHFRAGSARKVKRRRPCHLTCALDSKNSSNSKYISSQDFFEAFLRRRRASGDFVARTTDALWRLDDDLAKEASSNLKETMVQKTAEAESGEGGFLKLSQAREWTQSQAEEPPKNMSSVWEEREMERTDRRRQGLLEYEALKRELSTLTVGAAVLCDAYCFLLLSERSGISYAVGAVGSLLYLQLLFKHADTISESDVPDIFMRRRRKKIGIDSKDLEDSFKKLLAGSSQALASPRLVIPAVLVGLWALSLKLAEDTGGFHLELAPLLLGFLAYKAAALVQVYRDNKDLAMDIQAGKE